MDQDSLSFSAEELSGLRDRLIVDGSPNSEFSEDDDWSVTSVESYPEGKVTIRLRNILDRRRITIAIPLGDFQEPIFPRDIATGSQRAYDMGVTIMEFSGINDFDKFRNDQEIEVTVGGEFKLLN